MGTNVFQSILTKHTGDTLVSYESLIGKGNVNQIYLLKTEANSYVLRVSSESDLSRFAKEKWCMEQATILGIPGPTVLGLGAVETGTYLLLTFVPGENGTDLVGDTTHVWHTLGRYARAIHSIPVSGFGEDMTADGVFTGTWSVYVQENLQGVHPSGPLVATGRITLTQSERLTELFVTLRREHLTFGLVHQDLSLKNTLVRADGKVSLLDWGSAQVHVVPHMELEEILSAGLAWTSLEFGAFLEGYDLSADEVRTLKPQLLALRVLMRTDKLRWALDRRPERVELYTSMLQEAIQAL